MSREREQQLADATAVAAVLPFPRVLGVVLRALVRTGWLTFEVRR